MKKKTEKIYSESKSVKERAVLTKKQSDQLYWFSGNCRKLWNELVDKNESLYKKHKKIMTKKEASQWLTKKILKKYKFFEESGIPRSALQYVIENYYNAMNAFYLGQSNKPVRKTKKKTTNSVSFQNQRNSIKIIECEKSKNYAFIKLPNIGKVKFRVTKLSKKLFGIDCASNFTLQKVTVKEDVMGKWNISFNFRKVMTKKEHNNLTTKFEAKSSKGFDLNIKETVVTSHDEMFKLDLDKIYKIEEEIAELQKQLSHKYLTNKKIHGDSFDVIGLRLNSNKELKLRKKIQKLHKQKTNIIKDFQHKTVNKIIDIQDGLPLLLIGEDLDISAMIKSAKGTKENPGINVESKSDLARRWVGTSPYRFRSILEQKTRFNPLVTLLFINPAMTSRTCNKCKSTNSIRIAEYFECRDCGHVDNANKNASYNIEFQGLMEYKQISPRAGTLSDKSKT